MSTTIQDVIERSITVKAAKERVFGAITDPKQIINWFPDAVEGTIEPGSRPIFDFGTYGKVELYITAVDPYDYFAYKWVPSGDGGDVLAQKHTLVEFRLEETSEGTLVRLTESGFASLDPDQIAARYKDNTEGWEYMFDRLEKLFA